MRDTHGRYVDVKTIRDNGPTWAHGCANCKRGIVTAPELTGACEMYLERLVQAVDGDIVFCECQAGQSYRISLRTRYQKLVEEAKRHPLMGEFVKRKTHPDIDSARWAMAQSVGTMHQAPSVHFDATPKPPVAPTVKDEDTIHGDVAIADVAEMAF